MNFSVFREAAGTVFDLFLPYAPFAAFVVLAIVAWKLWRFYLMYRFVSNLGWTTLEIKLPREITKTPKAMELVLASMYQTYEGNPLDRLLTNFKRAWFSLEIVSDGGTIHFYIYTQKFFKNIVESALYAHYPDIEVHEVPDYTLEVPYDMPGATEKWQLDGFEYKLSREDAIPIKTYIDSGLDKEGVKEEYKVDPLNQVLEFMGSIKPEEKLWLQFVITSAKDEGWKEEGREFVNEVLRREAKTKGPAQLSESGFPILPSLTAVEKDIVEAIERSLGQLGFVTGARVLYLAKEGHFRLPVKVGLIGLLRHYGSENLNSFKMAKDIGYTFIWEDPFKFREEKQRRQFFEGYVRRSFFYPPVIRDNVFIMTDQELATVFHFPGSVAETPSLGRIESKRGEAPVNLPM